MPNLVFSQNSAGGGLPGFGSAGGGANLQIGSHRPVVGFRLALASPKAAVVRS